MSIFINEVRYGYLLEPQLAAFLSSIPRKWRLFFEVEARAGLRYCEVIRIRPRDIGRHTIVVPPPCRSPRKIPVEPELCRVLRDEAARLVCADREVLFNLSRWGANRRLIYVQRRSGTPPFPITQSTLRNSYIVQRIIAGHNLCEIATDAGYRRTQQLFGYIARIVSDHGSGAIPKLPEHLRKLAEASTLIGLIRGDGKTRAGPESSIDLF